MDKYLFTEGDINLSPEREHWYQQLTDNTRSELDRDARFFLHQSLSTPCLDVLESCEGIHLIDISGKRYMDFHGNNVHQVGHKNPYVLEKVKAQLDTLPFCPRRYTNQPIIDLAEKLCSLLPSSLNRVLFAPGGTSAIGMALKLARVVTGKTRVVSYHDSFHGASLDAIGAGGEEQFKKYMGEFPETVNIPAPQYYRKDPAYPDEISYALELEKAILKNPGIGAFVAETIRNTDVQIPSATYWKKIREICDQYQVLLILDEIPIAFGRTGKMFAFEHYEIEPDILCLGKGLGAGIIPIAAIITRDKYNIATEVSLGHYTHEKNPLGAAAGLAMLEEIEKKELVFKTTAHAEFLREKLEALQARHEIIGDIRGIGLLWGIELVKDRDTKEKAISESNRVLYRCLQNGLSFKISQGNVIQWVPPLTITEEELARAITILDEALSL